MSPTQAEVTVTVYCDHQSIYSSALPGAVNILVDNQYATLDSPALEQDDNTPRSTQLASKTFTIDLADGQSRSIPVQAEWGYGGSYGSPWGQVQLDSLECGGTITLSR